MTVPSQVNKSGPYTENGVTTTFEYGFRILDETHIEVVRSIGGVETILSLGADYTVTGVGADNGDVVLNVPGNGSELVLIRKAPFTQELDLENQGPYFAEDVERALDLATMRDQQLAEKIDRAVVMPVSADPTDLGALVGGILVLTPIADDIQTVAGISGPVTEVADISAEVSAVAGISGQILTVSGISSEVTAVAANETNIDAVAANATNINAVAGISANITTVSGISSEVTAVAANETNIDAVAGSLPIIVDTAAVLAAVIRKDIDQSAPAFDAATKLNIRKNTLSVWEQIGPRIVVSSNTATIDWTDLEDFHTLRISGVGAVDINNYKLGLRMGAGAVVTSSSYRNQWGYVNSSAAGGSAAILTSMVISATIGTSDAYKRATFETLIFNFNDAAPKLAHTNGGASDGGGADLPYYARHTIGIGACDTLQLLNPGGQLVAGTAVILEGIRG